MWTNSFATNILIWLKFVLLRFVRRLYVRCSLQLISVKQFARNRKCHHKSNTCTERLLFVSGLLNWSSKKATSKIVTNNYFNHNRLWGTKCSFCFQIWCEKNNTSNYKVILSILKHVGQYFAKKKLIKNDPRSIKTQNWGSC